MTENRIETPVNLLPQVNQHDGSDLCSVYADIRL